MKNQYQLECNIAQTLNIIGDKWSLLILHAMMIGKATYKELQESLEGIPTNLLSSRLKELETNDLIQVNVYQEHPPRYQYTLTKKGEDLSDIFNAIILWGERNLNQCYKKLIHENCEGQIELQYYCKKCKKMVTKDHMITKVIK